MTRSKSCANARPWILSAIRRNRTANAFKIAFEGEEPRKVMQVVNAMATLVIDQNLKVRESQAIGTVEFLEHELVKMRRKLEEVEAALKDFRKNHMGELPDQLAGNLMVLDRLQQQLSDKQKSLRDEKNRLISLENQIQTGSGAGRHDRGGDRSARKW